MHLLEGCCGGQFLKSRICPVKTFESADFAEPLQTGRASAAALAALPNENRPHCGSSVAQICFTCLVRLVLTASARSARFIRRVAILRHSPRAGCDPLSAGRKFPQPRAPASCMFLVKSRDQSANSLNMLFYRKTIGTGEGSKQTHRQLCHLKSHLQMLQNQRPPAQG